MAVYDEIRKQVGADFPVGIKLNSADFQRGGFTEEESIATIHALAEAGIDLIEISGGTYEAPAMSGAFQQPQKATTAAREAYFLEFAEKVRAAVRVPLLPIEQSCYHSNRTAGVWQCGQEIELQQRHLRVDHDRPVNTG